VERELAALAEESGVELVGSVERKLASYLELLERWGRSINLTADPRAETVLRRQLPDAFQLASLLEVGGVRCCLDVGAGAGLVGVPLALLRPELELTLVEPSQKKCAFLRTVAYELELGLRIQPERLETIEERFAIVMSRATWAPETWVKQARRVLAPGGEIVVFSRLEPSFEGLVEVRRRCSTLEGGGERCVSIWKEA
jgi:16S rRNA (guanine527-N7)-methyltransferase